ncbi:MAG TPA: thiamine phosphate synthase, partial [Xanthobacteraceae bacterium]|nr:thiamine phosphate synthase [Xanthobacteraceae bacterium]
FCRDAPQCAAARTHRRAGVHPRRHGAFLSIGGDLDLAVELAADSVHLGAGASVAAARRKLGPSALIGISAHGEADIAAAQAAGADYATLSPIYPTQSKPGYGPALGVAAITQAARSPLPVLALGGVTAERAPACMRAGAAGIAVMGEVMRAAARPGGVGEAVQALARACDPA